MTDRLNFAKTAPAAYQAMLGLGAPVKQSGLDAKLIELVKIRASQINGCAFCLDLHRDLAHKAGENDTRIVMLDAWRETSFFTERERTALAWAEALTLITDGHAPDTLYQETLRHFSEAELAALSLAVVQINAWNRLMIAFRTPVPEKKPAGMTP